MVSVLFSVAVDEYSARRYRLQNRKMGAGIMKTLSLVCCLVLALCGVLRAEPLPPVRVVASFSLLGDLVKQVGGEAVDVVTLAGPDSDLHAFQPTPQDAKTLAQADIIAINGLGIDHFIQRLIVASHTKGKLLVASAGVKARFFGEGKDAVADPHAWQDPRLLRVYVRNIAGALIKASPDNEALFRANADRLDAELKKMDAFIREQFKDIPPAKRKIVTTHDAFGYFGDAYDIRFIAPLGMNEEAEPSAQDIAALIQFIKREKVRTVFIENLHDPRLMEQISKETGAKLGGTLYSDALSPPDGPVPTTLDIFRTNVPKLREAMMGNGP